MTGPLSVAVADGVAQVRLERPDRANALHRPLWDALGTTFRALDEDPAVRAVVLSGAGRHFCAGIDLAMLGELRELGGGDCAGRGSEAVHGFIVELQESITAIERCRKPVIAAVHGACVGAGLDLAVTCDIRLASADARFCLKEVDLGVAADVGVLQRLPRIVGEGVARELAFTARVVDGREAERLRLVNRCVDDPAQLATVAAEMAAQVAAKSPIALRGTKRALNWARDHTIADGLEQIATWNAAALLSADLDEALAAAREGRSPTFRD
jgi:enoyl-CoA hydratase